MQADMQRHKKIIPMAGKQVCNAGKTESTLNVQESENVVRKNDSAYHKEEGTNQNAAVYESLHDAPCVVFPTEHRAVPASVQNNVDSPQNKKPYAQDFMYNISRK